jgi:hypothetical protein
MKTTETFWDQLPTDRLNALLKDETTAFDRTEAAKAKVVPTMVYSTRRPRPKVQAKTSEPVAAAPQHVPEIGHVKPSFGKRVKRKLIESSILILTGIALAVFVPKWMAQNISWPAVPVASKPVTDVAPKTEQEAVTPKKIEAVASVEPSKPAPEPSPLPRLRRAPLEEVKEPEPVKPAPEVAARPEPPVIDTSEPVFDHNRKPGTGVFLEWAAAGDPATLHKPDVPSTKGMIDWEARRLVGDRVDIARAIREAQKHIVPGTVMWAEQQPDGAIDVHTYVNTYDDRNTSGTKFELTHPLANGCTRTFGSTDGTGRLISPDRLQLPREMWYRTGSSMAQNQPRPSGR